MSIKKKINFIFFYSFYRPGPGPAPLRVGRRDKILRRLGFSLHPPHLQSAEAGCVERSIKNPAVVFGLWAVARSVVRSEDQIPDHSPAP